MAVDGDRFQAALDFIDNRSNYAQGSISGPSSSSGGVELGLLRTRALLDALGSPDRAYPIVHIAGTKGKGSTAAYVAAIGKAAGYRTGLSTSPHLHSFRERIAIGGSLISRNDFGRIGSLVQSTTEQPGAKRPRVGPRYGVRVGDRDGTTRVCRCGMRPGRCRSRNRRDLRRNECSHPDGVDYHTAGPGAHANSWRHH